MDPKLFRTQRMVRKGERVLARQINGFADSINRMSLGYNAPKQVVQEQVTAQSAGASTLYARTATIGNHSLTGLTFGDALVSTLLEEDLVLVWQQTDSAENGIYAASAGAWTLIQALDETLLYQPIFVAQGFVFANSIFYVIAENTVEWIRQSYWTQYLDVDTNITPSGTQTIDGASVGTDAVVLVSVAGVGKGIYYTRASAWDLLKLFYSATNPSSYTNFGAIIHNRGSLVLNSQPSLVSYFYAGSGTFYEMGAWIV